jgi:hypothetical protein
MRAAQRSFLAAVLLLSFAGPAAALDLSTKDSTTQKIDQDIIRSFKKNVELKDSKGKKKSKSWSKGKETKRDDSAKVSGSEGKTSSLDITLSPDIFFLRRIREVEQAGKVEPYATCQVVSHRLLLPIPRNCKISPMAALASPSEPCSSKPDRHIERPKHQCRFLTLAG